MKKVFFIFATFFMVFYASAGTSRAVELEAGDWRFGINGFLDAEFVYEGEKPMKPMTMPNGMVNIGKSEEIAYIDQNHLNLIFSAEKDNLRINVNLESRHTFEAFPASAENPEHSAIGHFEIRETYGVYTVNDALKLHAGSMLSPFGIYNEVRYMLPLFSTVVIPLMYEMPMNYSSGVSEIKNDLTPYRANFMMSGNISMESSEFDYYLYVANGERTTHGTDKNKDKGIGARTRFTLMEDYKLGVSYFTVENDSGPQHHTGSKIGRETLASADLELNFPGNLKLESEYVESSFTERENRKSYYTRLTWYPGKLAPFISYDYFEDNGNLLYQRGFTRNSVGASYSVSPYITLKAEFLKNTFGGKKNAMAPDLPDGVDKFDTFQASVIFVF